MLAYWVPALSGLAQCPFDVGAARRAQDYELAGADRA